MKRNLMILIMVAAIGIPAMGAWAQGRYGARGGAGWGASSEQRQQFLDETASLRESLYQKQDQLRTLLADPNSDPAQIGTLEKEMFQLRQQISEKAQAAGLGFGKCPGAGYGRGMGYGARYMNQ